MAPQRRLRASNKTVIASPERAKQSPRLLRRSAPRNDARDVSLGALRHLDRAVRLFLRKKYDQSLAASAKALQEDPDSAAVYALRAQIFSARADWDHSLESAEKALALDPKNPEAMASVGGAYFGKKDYDRAAQSLERALKAGYPGVEIYYDLAAVYLALKDYEAAGNAAQAALERDPGFYFHPYLVGRVYHESGRDAQAVAYFLRTLKLNPDFLPAQEYLGLAFLKLGDHKKARQIFEKILVKDPQNSVAKENLPRTRKKGFRLFG